MRRRQSFSQFLIGTASLKRQPFFYAYSGMWLHLTLGVPILVILLDVSLLDTLSSMAISSLSVGIIVYSLMTRDYELFITLVSYGISLVRAFEPAFLGLPFLISAIIIALASGFLLISSEYRRYTREIYEGEESAVPLWITVTISTTLVLLFILGIRLL